MFLADVLLVVQEAQSRHQGPDLAYAPPLRDALPANIAGNVVAMSRLRR